MKVMKGKQSLEFEHPPYLKGWSSVVGEKEGEGPLGQAFDQIIDDPLFGEETWELAEGRFMRQAALLAIQKAEITKNQVRYAFAGDLLSRSWRHPSGSRTWSSLSLACTEHVLPQENPYLLRL